MVERVSPSVCKFAHGVKVHNVQICTHQWLASERSAWVNIAISQVNMSTTPDGPYRGSVRGQSQ